MVKLYFLFYLNFIKVKTFSVIVMYFIFADCVVPGAGGFQIAAYDALMRYKSSVKGRAQLGVQVNTVIVF